MLLVCGFPFPGISYLNVDKIDFSRHFDKMPENSFWRQLDSGNLRPMKSIVCEPMEGVLQVFNLNPHPSEKRRVRHPASFNRARTQDWCRAQRLPPAGLQKFA